jgi:hypothetical protein
MGDVSSRRVKVEKGSIKEVDEVVKTNPLKESKFKKALSGMNPPPCEKKLQV